MQVTCSKPSGAAKLVEVLDDLVEPHLIEIDQVHLVHGERYLFDAKQRHDAGVPPRLGEHAEPRIDQKHGEIAV